MIVIIDDDDLGREIMVRYLKATFSCPVLDYDSAVFALLKGEDWTQKAKIIITDVQMPDMRGDELTAIVKKHYPEIKVVIISGIEEKLLSMLAEETGADAFLKKRFDLDKLVETVKRLML